MPYSIVELDGIQVDPLTKRLPIEIHADPHPLNGVEHIGVLGDAQIPENIMRTTSHQLDPHNQLIDGRNVSADGSKLDTIESGAEVNNLSDMQAQDLTSGGHTSWHSHDQFYYRKNEFLASGSARVAWNNLTNIPSSFPPSVHDHSDVYYTKVQLDAGQLDTRYFIKAEVNTLLGNKSDLVHEHNDVYYLKSQTDTLLASKAEVVHAHDDRYYTESEVDSLLLGKSDSSHMHDVYATKTEVSDLLDDKSDVSHLHDDRYYTETEIDSLLAGLSVVTHNHDSRYYTESEIDTLLSGKSDTTHSHNDAYYTKGQLDAGQLDTRYYTESEIDVLLQSMAMGIRGAVDTYSNLPASANVGDLYIVRQTVSTNEEGFYRWSGTTWEFLANNTGLETHNDLGGLNTGDYQHLTLAEKTDLTDGGDTVLHVHDGRYYTETESDARFAPVSHDHDVYYSKVQLDAGQLNTLYYTKTNLQTSGQASVAWGNLTSVPSTFPPSAHNQSASTITSGTLGLARGGTNNTSYTSARFIAYDGTRLSSTAFDSMSFASATHNHDTAYYQKSEVDTLLSNKSDVSHLHDDRYFTEAEIVAGYYTKTNLQTAGEASVAWANLSGVPTEFTPTSHDHDGRYYTEAESDARFAPLDHNHDSRYYDKAYIDSTHYTKIESDARYVLSSHNHNNLYYTESEIDDKLSQITIAVVAANDPETDITASELETLTNGSNADGLHTHDFSGGGGASTLDEAYGDWGAGRSITVDHGPVTLNAKDGFAPIKLTPINYTPNQWLGGGEMCVRDGDLYIYDATRGKWLSSDASSVTISGNSSTTSGYLYIDNTIMNSTTGICMPFNATITGLTVSNSNSGAYGSMDIRCWGSTIAEVSFSGYSTARNNLNINVSEEDVIQIYCDANGNGRPNKPVVLLLFKRRI